MTERAQSFARGLQLVESHRLGRELTAAEKEILVVEGRMITALEGNAKGESQHFTTRSRLLEVCLDLADPGKGALPPKLQVVNSGPGLQMLNAPSEKIFAFDDVMDMLKEYQATWLRFSEAFLRDRIWDGLSVDRATLGDPLELAVGRYWFCKNCKYTMEYPGVLSHQCPGLYDDAPYYDELEKDPGTMSSPGCYQYYQVKQLVSAADVTKRLLDILELPPQASVKDADAAVGRFICARCDQTSTTVKIMTWRAAVSIAPFVSTPFTYLCSWSCPQVEHWLVGCPEVNKVRTCDWCLVPALPAEESREKTAFEHAKAERKKKCLWYCTLCANKGAHEGNRFFTADEVSRHLETK